MTPDNFLEILDKFPGQEQLKQEVPNINDYRYTVDYAKVLIELQRGKMKIDLGKNPDLWSKYICFMYFMNYFASNEFGTLKSNNVIPKDEDIFNESSLMISRNICTAFSMFSEKINNIYEMKLEILINFLKSGKSLSNYIF